MHSIQAFLFFFVIFYLVGHFGLGHGKIPRDGKGGCLVESSPFHIFSGDDLLVSLLYCTCTIFLFRVSLLRMYFYITARGLEGHVMR